MAVNWLSCQCRLATPTTFVSVEHPQVVCFIYVAFLLHLHTKREHSIINFFGKNLVSIKCQTKLLKYIYNLKCLQ